MPSDRPKNVIQHQVAGIWQDYVHVADYERLEKELAAARAVLKTISEIHPDKDSDEGFNEWGEAECYRKAVDVAQAALKGADHAK